MAAWDWENLRPKILAGYTCTANIIDAKKSNDITSLVVVSKVCVHFASFIDNIIISISIFLFIWFYLYLARNCFLFVLKAIVKDSKIDINNDNWNVKIASRCIDKNIIQYDWGGGETKKKNTSSINKCLKNVPPIDD